MDALLLLDIVVEWVLMSAFRLLPLLAALAAAFALVGFAIKFVTGLDDAAPLRLASSVGAAMRDLPATDVPASAQRNDNTKAIDAAEALVGVQKSAPVGSGVGAAADPQLANQLPRGQVSAATAGSLIGSASPVGQSALPIREPTAAETGAATVAHPPSTLTGSSRSTQDRPAAMIVGGDSGLRAAGAGDEPATASLGKEDVKLAERAATMASQVSQGASEILRNLPDNEAAAPAGASGPAQVQPTPSASADPAFSVSSAHYLPEPSGQGTLILTGRGLVDRRATVYVDDARLGEASSQGAVNWQFRARTSLAAGQHTVRADIARAPGRPAQSAILVFARAAQSGNTGEAAIVTIATGTRVEPQPEVSGLLMGQKMTDVGQSSQLPTAPKVGPAAASGQAPPTQITVAAVVAKAHAGAHLVPARSLIWVRVFRGKRPSLVHVPRGSRRP